MKIRYDKIVHQSWDCDGTSAVVWRAVCVEFFLANPATQEMACARPTVLSDLARAQEMRHTEKKSDGCSNYLFAYFTECYNWDKPTSFST